MQTSTYLPARVAVAAWILVVAVAVPAGRVWAAGPAPERHYLANGLDVTLYPSDALEARLDRSGDTPVIRLDDGRFLSVITDIDDPSIYNKGDGRFHPFQAEAVLRTLTGVTHPEMSLSVTVYLLPYPRRAVLVSSTSGLEIFLSPHVLEIHPSVSAYIVAHELGHVFHNRRLPDSDADGWSAYRLIRRIDDPARFNETSQHAYQPREIFAEDFRVLFGGDEAAFGGTIENSELASPNDVAGLRDFMVALGDVPVRTTSRIRATSYPNPFNPETEIRVGVPAEFVDAGQAVSVKIFDVSGALVNEVFSGVPATEEFAVRWNGRTQSGIPVASGNYYALVRAGDAKTTVKLVLIK